MSISTVESLTQLQLKEVDFAIDARATVQAIILWAQLSVVEEEEYLSESRRPITHVLIPSDTTSRGIFYDRLSAKAVSAWKHELDNPEKKSLARSVIEDCVRDTHLPVIYAQNLRNYGHNVSARGISTGTHDSLVESIYQFERTTSDETSLREISRKAGGLTTDMLSQAQHNLQLSDGENEHIDNFFTFRRKYPRLQVRLLPLLNSAQEVRKHYADSGLNLDDLMSLWGINTSFSETKSILKKLLDDESRRDRLLNAVSNLLPNQEKVTESQAYFARAKKLNLPNELLSWEAINARNLTILKNVANILHFTEITGKEPGNTIIFTGKPGARTREVSASYVNDNNEMVNVPLVSAYAPEPQQVKTVAHELTHAIHVRLISRLFGYEAWLNIDSGIKELFANLVDESVVSKVDNTRAESDEFRQALVSWFQPLYSYSQIRLLEEVSLSNHAMSDNELLSVERKITQEVMPFYILSSGGMIFDLSQFRRAPFSSEKPNDGIVYVISEINVSDKDKHDQSSAKQANPKLLFLDKWGKDWVYNTEAFKLLIAAMIASHELSSTKEVYTYIQSLFDGGIDVVNNILSSHSLAIS